MAATTQTQKITPSDVLQQLGQVRTLVDSLPDTVASQRAALQGALDTAANYVRQALPKPGTYVTAGGAAAMAGLAAVVGAVGGGFIGHKLGAKAASTPKQLPARELAAEVGAGAAEDELEVITITAAEAAAVRKARARGKPRAAAAAGG